MRVVAVERLKRLELRLGSRISHPLDGLVIERIMMIMMMIKDDDDDYNDDHDDYLPRSD